MENGELISSAIGIIPGAIATLGIFLEKKRLVAITIGATVLITGANIISTILTDNTVTLTGAMIGISMPIIAAGIKGFSGENYFDSE
jgi:hypothetical protein